MVGLVEGTQEGGQPHGAGVLNGASVHVLDSVVGEEEISREIRFCVSVRACARVCVGVCVCACRYVYVNI